ncbi:hypothetical protein [Mucilaginibacter sp. HD30]
MKVLIFLAWIYNPEFAFVVPFQVEIEWQQMPLSLQAEQLDNLADEEGFIRFDVRAGERRAAIFVNIEVHAQVLENHYETLQYPEKSGDFSFDKTLAAGEITLIGQAIREQE